MITFYKAIGVMSGTSIDGLDIAYCSFKRENNQWTSTIHIAETITYSNQWKEQLSTAHTLNGLELSQLDIDYGKWIGDKISLFINKHQLSVDAIGSHGHTVFHQPEKSLTLQIGNGSAICAGCQIPTVCDFRTIDVQLGGQGAPLVPIGDMLLYHNFDYCLNLGGFANISYRDANASVAFDICPANIVLNQYAEQLGKTYDDKGMIAKSGRLDSNLLNDLNALPYYDQMAPKSLGKEWVDKSLTPLIHLENEIPDILCTVNHHISAQIVKAVSASLKTKPDEKRTLLITGGGAYNDFLIDLLDKQLPKNVSLVIPHASIIEFKESQIFAFLAVLKLRNEPSNIMTVTGATREVSLGVVYDYE